MKYNKNVKQVYMLFINVYIFCRGGGRNATRDDYVETGDEPVEGGCESIEAVEDTATVS